MLDVNKLGLRKWAGFLPSTTITSGSRRAIFVVTAWTRRKRRATDKRSLLVILCGLWDNVNCTRLWAMEGLILRRGAMRGRGSGRTRGRFNAWNLRQRRPIGNRVNLGEVASAQIRFVSWRLWLMSSRWLLRLPTSQIFQQVFHGLALRVGEVRPGGVFIPAGYARWLRRNRFFLDST